MDFGYFVDFFLSKYFISVKMQKIVEKDATFYNWRELAEFKIIK